MSRALWLLALLSACKANNAPGALAVRIDPAVPRTGDDLVAAIATPASDPDGDEVTYAFSWTVDGADALIGDDTVPADRTEPGQVWQVDVTPTDGTDDGPTASAAVTIAGSPSVDVSLEPVGTDDLLVATVVATDGRGQPAAAEITWAVDGTTLDEHGDTLDGTVFFDKGDTVTVTASVTDGDETVTDTAEIVVQNTGPGGTTVYLSREAPFDVSDIVCGVMASDPDSDPLSFTFAWDVDGVAFEAAGTTFFPGDTVLASDTMAGQTWTCTATPSDGETDGPPASASAVVVPWYGDETFTPCGTTGPKGPSQESCDGAYKGTTLAGLVLVSEGIQTWYAPFDGDFVVTACGAQGASGSAGHVGGAGACVTGTFAMAIGDTIRVVPGQMGVGQSLSSNAGGGGGTWVVRDDEPLLVAGGGGGTRTDAQRDGCAGVAGNYGVAGSGSTSDWTCDLRTDGLGEGGRMSSQSWGSGGGGFLGDGEDDGYDSNGDGVADTFYGRGGKSWFDGLQGGGPDTSGSCGTDGYGGFGGGGGGNGCYGGGGGGGYSGGDGGWIAGGGGSWNGAADGYGSDGANAGDGWVLIQAVER